MTKFIDISGKRYGKLIATNDFVRSDSGIRWRFICDCGNVKLILKSHVVSGKTTSCGCSMKEQISKRRKLHGQAKSKTYHAWNSMRGRCLVEKHPSYKYYGGRGITICNRWLEPNGKGFINFLEDMGERPEGLSLDRIENSGNYEPSNCRWATKSQQNYNRRSLTNKTGKVGVNKISKNSWCATIGHDTILGYFDSFEAAVKAREDAEKIIGRENSHCFYTSE